MEPLIVPGTLDSLSAVGRYVLAAADEAGLEKGAAYRLRLSVDEIVTNIIVHGYQEAGLTGPIEVTATIDDGALRIAIEDTASPYDVRETPPPADLDKELEDRHLGGLGVFLALDGVDDFAYERLDQGNRNVFIMRRQAKPSTPA